MSQIRYEVLIERPDGVESATYEVEMTELREDVGLMVLYAAPGQMVAAIPLTRLIAVLNRPLTAADVGLTKVDVQKGAENLLEVIR